MGGGTAFEERVYDALRRVPKGRVTTYKLLAESIGCGSPQAVGQALRRNPLAPVVPCHRVISSDLGPGGFQGVREGKPLCAKLKLLAAEGVQFSNGKLADPKRVYRFEI